MYRTYIQRIEIALLEIAYRLTTDIQQENSNKLIYFSTLPHQFHAFCVGLQQHTKSIIVITVQVRNIAANSNYRGPSTNDACRLYRYSWEYNGHVSFQKIIWVYESLYGSIIPCTILQYTEILSLEFNWTAIHSVMSGNLTNMFSVSFGYIRIKVVIWISQIYLQIC